MLTNPASGHGSAPHAAERAVAQLHRRGVDVVAIAGTDAEHARRLVDGALERGMDALVVVGGDGIISLALQVLAQTDVPLAIIPAGTGNDHAREFRIPTTDPEAAADVVVDGAVQTVDLGRIKGADGTDKWFGTVMAAGFDSLVTDRTNRMRWPHGRMRYNVAMVAELSKLRLLPFRLSFDGEEVVTDLTLAAFGNTKSYGGGMRICPNADPTDGLLDATMVASASRTKLIRLFPTVFKGTHVDLDEVRTARAQTITVDSPGINAYADGEYVCPLPVEVSAVPGALKILRPATRLRIECRRLPDSAIECRRLPDSAIEPGHLARVASAAIRLEGLIPCGAEHRVEFGDEHVGPRGHQRAHPHLADHHIAVGAHHAAPQAELRRVAEPLSVHACTGVLGHLESQHRP